MTEPNVEDYDVETRRALVAGGLVAVFGGVLWAAAVLITTYEIGWIAWGVGAAVGGVMAAKTPERSRELGIRAGLFAAMGLIIGKWLILQIGAVPQVEKEIRASPEIMLQVAFTDLVNRGQVPPELLARLDSVPIDAPAPPDLEAELRAVAEVYLANMSEDTQDSLARGLAEMFVGDLSLMERARASMSGFDLLWFLLAVGTAWRLVTARQSESVAVVADDADVTDAEGSDGQPDEELR
jgi:hypothetical protein